MDYLYVNMPLALLASTELTPAEKIVLAYLNFKQGKNSISWPSMQSIGTGTGLSSRNARRAVRELERKRFISVSRGGPRSGGNASNEYKVLSRGADNVSVGVRTGCPKGTDKSGRGVRTSCPSNNISKITNEKADDALEAVAARQEPK